MTLISKLYGGSLRPNDPRRFLVEAMVCGMYADGVVKKEEIEVLERNLQEHEIFSGLNRHTTAELIEIATESILFAGGPMNRIDAIARGLPARTHRMAAFACASEVCYSDGESSEERIYLERLRQALLLEEDEATALKEAARRERGMMEVEDRTRAMRQIMPRFIDAMAIMALADGVVTDAERDAVIGCLRTIADMAVFSDEEIIEAVTTAFARINEKDIEGEVSAMAQSIRSNGDRYWALVYMSVVAMADGYQNWRHMWLLPIVKDRFGFSEAQMDRAMDTAKLTPMGRKLTNEAILANSGR
jgi:tellurite resistance protein